MLNNLKSKYILQIIFENIQKNSYLKLINYNKNIQNKLNISIDNYIHLYNKKFQIEIEITMAQLYIGEKNKEYKFINIINEEDEKYYHIYFNDETEEIKRTYIKLEEKASKIKVLIDKEVKSIEALFEHCYCIEGIKFIKFNRTDFTSYKKMFYWCQYLRNLDILNLKLIMLKIYQICLLDVGLYII